MPASLHSESPARKALSASHPYQKLAIDERVKRILRDTPLFDGHNDLPQQPRAVTHGKIYDQLKFDFSRRTLREE
jgi:membrane dipeptidase